MGKSKEWSEYEKFIAILLNGITSSGRKISDIQFGKNNRIQGICGQKHQIDVSFIDHSFDEPTLILIECKRKSTPINLDVIKVLKATFDDIALNFNRATKFKAMLVTTAEIRRGARKYANFYGVIIEQVPHSNRFTFKYENIISAGIIISAGNMPLRFSAKLIKKCKNCGEKFEQINEETICPICGFDKA